MSSHLWKAYYDNDLESFRKYLETAVYHTRPHATRGGNSNTGTFIGSPGGYGTSPVLATKARKGGQATPSSGGHGVVLTKSDVNWRDTTGLTLLHHAASSTAENAPEFATALIEHPFIDLYIQDAENGWTALHRAFYFGNVSIARLMLERDAGDALGKTTGHIHQTIGLIKVKDREGHGPLDLYAATIKDRTLRPQAPTRQRLGSHGSDEERPNMIGDGDDEQVRALIRFMDVDGDQLFTFGSNQNVTLGFGDEDDRQFPERIHLRRPEHLIRRFYQEHLDEHEKKWSAHEGHAARRQAPPSGWIDDLPFIVRSKPLLIQDVHMAKLSTAVLTSDPEANLYMCGHGQGGRLGTGDEQTRFNFVCIEGGALSGKRVANVALGQNHTLALSDEGEIFSWGNNGYGQLGYSLPRTSSNDEDPISTIPKQIYGILKRESVVGVAASRIHSVAHTGSALYTFGKNEGQLGIMDSDARSLEVQTTPRKVAASLFASPIDSVCAIDRATVCLLENHEVWVFANFGYAKVQFPLEGFTNYFLKQSFLVTSYDNAPNKIMKLTGGGDTVCALSSRGGIYTFSISQRLDNQTSASTTNPTKIRSAITPPQQIWSPKENNMAARDVGVDSDGSIVLSTEEGSVWKRNKRNKLKDAAGSGTADYKPKDYKFSRMPGLTRVLAVRASGSGAYAAVRRDCDVLKTQLVVEDPRLWADLMPLLSLKQLSTGDMSLADDDTRHRFWQGSQKPDELQRLKHAILESSDIEADLADVLERTLADPSSKYDAVICTSTSELRIPVHRFVLTGRSRVLRRGFRDLCETSTFTIPELAVTELDTNELTVLKFQGLDILTLIDLVLYMYTDGIIDFWHMGRFAPKMAYRYRQIRAELMKVASKLELIKLEPAVRQMVMPRPCLNFDFELAYADPAFSHDGSVLVQLEDSEVRVHSALVCARCPFFEGLFMGRAGGRWLSDRAEADEINVDLTHISSQTFDIVLRHVYADSGEELFDELVSIGLDDFLDSIMDVMSAANELMLDRLSQTCQSVIGRHVNVRNVCGLLNAISPSSVREFKDAGLEYLCLNLEAMLQGHHLNELDPDLLTELDDVVRENQLACMPFAKSGRAEMLLHERHPQLAAIIDRDRQAKIDAIALRTKFHDMETFQPGSLGDDISSSPLHYKTRRRSSNANEKPTLRPKASSKDMMFAMDEESDAGGRTPEQSPSIRPMTSPRGLEPIASSPHDDLWFDSRGKVLPSPKLGPQTSTPSGVATPRTPKSPPVGGKTPPSSSGIPWSLTPLPGPKTDMRNIMAQTATRRTSSLTQGLSEEQTRPSLPATPSSFNLGTPKMSQKDRKRMQQAQQQLASGELRGLAKNTPEPAAASSAGKTGNPWQQVHSPKVSPLIGVAVGAVNAPPLPSAKPTNVRGTSTPQLTMRQTVSHSKQPQPQPSKPVTGPAGQSALLQQRSVSDSKSHTNPHVSETHRSLGGKQTSTTQPSSSATAPQPSPASFSNSKPVPHSIRHQPPPDLTVLGLSMSEIVAQELAAKEEIKQALAKRDLQEIQAEQEFQEWWDKESARVLREEEEFKNRGGGGTQKGASSRRGRGRGGAARGAGRGGGGGGGGGGRGGRSRSGNHAGNAGGGGSGAPVAAAAATGPTAPTK